MIEIQHVLVALIHPSQASRLVKQLAVAAPLTELQHLKRVRKLQDGSSQLEVIVCLINQPSCSTKPEAGSHCAWEEALLRGLGVRDEVLRIIAEHNLQMRSLPVCSVQANRLPTLQLFMYSGLDITFTCEQ